MGACDDVAGMSEESNVRAVRTTRTARVQILCCVLFAAVWVLLFRSHVFAGNLGGAMILVAASFLLIPIATVFALSATAKLLSARASSDRKQEFPDAVFLVVGVTLSLAGVAICARIVLGMMTEG